MVSEQEIELPPAVITYPQADEANVVIGDNSATLNEANVVIGDNAATLNEANAVIGDNAATLNEESK